MKEAVGSIIAGVLLAALLALLFALSRGSHCQCYDDGSVKEAPRAGYTICRQTCESLFL